MSLLPRRRAGQPGQVAVHPGWTLSPPTAEGFVPEAEVAAELPASRWTSAPPLPPVAASAAAVMVTAAASEPLSFWVEAPAAPIAAVLSAPLPLPTVPEALPEPLPTPLPTVPSLAAPTLPEPAPASWTTEWEQVAATAPTAVPTALHTGPPVLPVPSAPQPLEPPPAAPLSALDVPLLAEVLATETPLAAQAVAFLQAAAPTAHIPPPPPTPARTVAVSAPAQQIVDRAIRTAPSAPTQRRSTVRLGFTDASVVDLRPDDPMAKALHTVADALIGREGR